ncbi:LytR/AlgR family response regulator transcription factor [Lewinella sp. IMCC34183]|uniref:LytR/AlgR family response regulator transcription factor n=1 Tax=Lewinella sp. IMCC34183 TaxID=2248762 RepID=UPI000E21DBB4|nr:LytTR family DNA-binding domain-containing protein [Lewinella sp. IMCC34183]
MPTLAPPSSSATLLLIDQGDSGLRRQVEKLCAHTGYRLLTEADLSEEARPRMALVRGGGTGVLRRLRITYPFLPVILLVGGDHPTHLVPTDSSVTVLSLPVRQLQLRVAVEMTLEASPPPEPRAVPQGLMIQAGERKLDSRAIRFVQASHVLVEGHLPGGETVVWRSTLTALEEVLPPQTFLRPHRSFLVNLSWVDAWSPERIKIGTSTIPVSRGRREEVESRLRNSFLHFG